MFEGPAPAGGGPRAGEVDHLRDGAVVIAAITSCTNTSNPSVMIGAGLLARNAVRRGLEVAALGEDQPGSRFAGRDRLPGTGRAAAVPGGPAASRSWATAAPPASATADRCLRRWLAAIRDDRLVVAAVLSGNRNFEARIHPLVRANYLASPLLVVAYALAGRWTSTCSPSRWACDPTGEPVYLRDLWPSAEEVAELAALALRPGAVPRRYGAVFEGDESWQSLAVPRGARYAWRRDSTYVKEPPFFADFDAARSRPPPRTSRGARILAVFGDSVTTDHISPAGSIAADSPGRPVPAGPRGGTGRFQHLRVAAGQPRGAWCGAPSPTCACAT